MGRTHGRTPSSLDPVGVLSRGMMLLWATLSLLTATLGAQTVTLKEISIEQRTLFVIENATFRLQLDPTAGGRLTSFYLKQARHDMVAGHGSGWGMFADMVSQQSWPGELQKEPYTVEVLERGTETVSIRLRRTATGQWQGYTAAVDGIRVEKTYTVSATSPNLHVHYRLINTTGRGKSPAFWVQSLFAAGPDKEENVYFRPSARGLDVTRYDTNTGTRIRPDDVRDPVAGWMATLNPETKTGLVFLLDYDYLRWAYNCQSAYSAEWFYDKVMIPAGGSWETDVLCVPVVGLSSVAYATDTLILAATPHERSLSFGVRATERPLSALSIACSVNSVDGAPIAAKTTFSLTTLSTEPTHETVPLSATIDPQECVIPLEISGAGLDVAPEIVYSQRDITVALLGGLGDETIYRLPVPPKRKRFLKPATIELRPAIPRHCLAAVGVYHRLLKLSKSVDLLGWEMIGSTAAKSRWTGHTLSAWPEDYARMMGYSIVVLANVDPRAIGAEGLEMLREFVSHGGGLLVLGGPFAFAREGFAGTCLEQMLPVVCERGPALTPLADGVLRPTGGSVLVAGLDLGSKPTCFWSHDLPLKPGANIAMSAGERPLLVLGRYGKGRVAVFLGAPLGTGAHGQTPFWNWQGWPTLLSRVMCDVVGD